MNEDILTVNKIYIDTLSDKNMSGIPHSSGTAQFVGSSSTSLDATLSTTSANAVKNSAITAELGNLTSDVLQLNTLLNQTMSNLTNNYVTTADGAVQFFPAVTDGAAHSVVTTDGAGNFTFAPPLFYGTTAIKLNNASALADTNNEFNRFKTTKDEILADQQNAPISCQAFLSSAANSVIATSDANNYHTFPPSGSTVHTHLQNNYMPLITTSTNIAASSLSLSATGATQLEVKDRIATTLTDPANSNSVQGLTIDTGALDNAYYSVDTNPPRFKRALKLECTHPQSSTVKKGLTTSIGGGSSQLWFDMSSDSGSQDYLMFGWNDTSTNTPSTAAGTGWLQIWMVANLVQMYGSLNTTGNMTLNGAQVQTSDQRIKTNIQSTSTTDAYTLARAIELKEYDYVDTSRPRTRYGFIAQQVESVYPEAVVTAPGNFTATGVPVADFENQDDVVFSDKKQVAKDKMFQLLFAAFQEAQNKIDALEARVAQLEG